MSIQSTLDRFRKSVMGEPTVVKVNMVTCGTCGLVHREGEVCKVCGDAGDPEVELTTLQKFIKTLRRRGPRRIEKTVVDWTDSLQVCAYCGSQFGRSLDVCPHCNRKVADSKTRFVRSLRQ